MLMVSRTSGRIISDFIIKTLLPAAGVFLFALSSDAVTKNDIRGVAKKVDRTLVDVVVVKLKSKGQVSGVIVQETENGIVLDMGYGTASFSNDDVEEIILPDGEQKKMLIAEQQKYLSGMATDEVLEKETRIGVQKRNEEYRTYMRKITERSGRGGHKIKFIDNSRITVKAILNNKVATALLVDTGAKNVSIPRKVADKLFGKNKKYSRSTMVSLADGSLRNAFVITLKSVEVGGAKAKNVDALVIDGGSKEMGLLGMSFLNRFHVNIDAENKEMILKDR